MAIATAAQGCQEQQDYKRRPHKRPAGDKNRISKFLEFILDLVYHTLVEPLIARKAVSIEQRVIGAVRLEVLGQLFVVVEVAVVEASVTLQCLRVHLGSAPQQELRQSLVALLARQYEESAAVFIGSVDTHVFVQRLL